MMIQKPLSDLNESDLMTLVQQSVEERETLDYKLEMYGTSDPEKREMLRDVSAMANARGGHLLIGVREENNIAVELVGIEEPQVAAERLMSSCLSGIHERMHGLDVRSIPLRGGRSILAVFVPASTRKPHMVTFQQEDRFWIRHGQQKMRMSVDELREACSSVQNLTQSTLRFIEGRRQRVMGLAARKPENPILWIAITPLGVSIDRFEIDRADLRALMKNPPGMRADGWVIRWSPDMQAEPTLYGLKLEFHGYLRLEIFRNGYSEFTEDMAADRTLCEGEDLGGGSIIIPKELALVEYTVSMYRYFRAVAALIGIVDPLILSWCLLNAKGLGLPRYPGSDRPPSEYYGPRIWHEDHLCLPESQVPSLGNPDSTAKQMLDRVWQAFGYERAPFFDESGGFYPPR